MQKYPICVCRKPYGISVRMLLQGQATATLPTQHWPVLHCVQSSFPLQSRCLQLQLPFDICLLLFKTEIHYKHFIAAHQLLVFLLSKGCDSQAGMLSAFFQSSQWSLWEHETVLKLCSFLVPDRTQLITYKHQLHEVELLSEAVTPASREQWQIFFPGLTDSSYVNWFLITDFRQPTSLCCPLTAGPPAREALGPERSLRSSSPIIFYCRQMHYISPLIHVINLICKNWLD